MVLIGEAGVGGWGKPRPSGRQKQRAGRQGCSEPFFPRVRGFTVRCISFALFSASVFMKHFNVACGCLVTHVGSGAHLAFLCRFCHRDRIQGRLRLVRERGAPSLC